MNASLTSFLSSCLSERNQQYFRVIFFLAVLVIFSLASYKRNFYWADEIILWKDTIIKSPQKARGYFSLGNAYTRKGRLYESLNYLNYAIKLNPYYSEAYKSRGVVYLFMGEKEMSNKDYMVYESLNRPEINNSKKK